MGNKINVSELLKNCPQGMELDYALFEDTIFIGVEENKNYPILIKLKDGSQKRLTKYGCHSNADYAKCVIFPKGKTTWDGFQRPFKDGDILATDLGSVFYLNTRLNTYEYYGCYVGIGGDGSFHICESFAYKECCGLATEEEKEKLFQAIKANGYKWNPETKKLEKLIKPIFKKGDKVRVKKGFPEPRIARIIEDVGDTFYTLVSVGKINFTDQDNWELVPNKFNISKLKPFDEVLVRDFDSEVWEIDFFSKLLDGKHFKCHGASYVQCIPYKGNEYLHNTTNACNPFYKTW